MENERFAWFSRKRIVYVIIGVAIVVVTIVLIAKYQFNVDLLSTPDLTTRVRIRRLPNYGYDLQNIERNYSPSTIGGALLYLCLIFSLAF